MKIVKGGGFLSASAPPDTADVSLVGVPFDGTSTFRAGSRFGPGAIRFWSQVLETYSPDLDMDLDDLALSDLGDLEIAVARWQAVEKETAAAVGRVLGNASVPLILGGEHLVSLPAIEACASRFPDLVVLQLDAHMDLRDTYLGLRHSHATVMRRVADTLGPERLIQMGIRSGTRREWAWAGKYRTVAESMEEVKERISGRPLYLTVDLDVLDPSVMPETGTPEPGGMSFRALHSVLVALKGHGLAGADVVEYCPAGNAGGPSGAVAAKIVREIILLAYAGRAGRSE